ncbi:MAG: hypothetical protein ACOZIN_07675 [Myxococcota bacterium]
MNRFFFAAVGLCAAVSFAQEIGTELPADSAASPPSTSPPITFDNPYAPPPSAPEAPVSAAVPGPSKGAFGLRASFGGGGIPAVSGTSSSGAGPAAPTFGFKYLATDSVALTFDAGLGLGFINGDVPFGFGAGVGGQAYLGSKEKPIRPYVAGGIGFGKGISVRGDDFVFALAAGGGAEYWFSGHFSVNGEALVGVPIDFRSGAVTAATFTPGIGATFYF